MNKKTGEIPFEKHEIDALNKVIIKETTRKGVNGYNPSPIRIQQDFSNCPTMAEQHTAHLTNINYLIERYKPDELAAYIAARNQYRAEITGHDFSSEPSQQDARNVVYRSKQEFEALPDDVKLHFRNHLEFLKFIDNPNNAEKMLKLGILTKKQIDAIAIPDDTTITVPITSDPNPSKNTKSSTSSSS